METYAKINQKYKYLITKLRTIMKFRVWDEKRNCWSKEPILFYPNEDIKNQGRIIQISTGLLSIDKKDVFEGDIIKFLYTVGDFAWEDMSEEEFKLNSNMSGKTFTGRIAKCPNSNNLEIVSYDKLYPVYLFPIEYARNAKIIGNIFENLKS